jgi:hypothetical protein
MRRKSDMWQDKGEGFLPAEERQEAEAAAADTRDRLAKLEEQLLSQYTSMATYAQIAQQAVETARAEARADLDREKATLISLLERVRTECTGEHPTPLAATAAQATDVSTLARIALLEDNFERLSYQFAQVLRSQEDLANSLTMMFEHQLRAGGEMVNAGD